MIKDNSFELIKKMPTGEYIDAVSTIYNQLQDDVSREIFQNRLMYAMTSDYEYIRRIIFSTVEGDKLLEQIKQADKISKVEGIPLILLGAGAWGKYLIQLFDFVKWDYVCDRRTGRLCGYDVIDKNEVYQKEKNGYYIISSKTFCDELHEELLKQGIAEEHIIDAGCIGRYMEEKQYFEAEFIPKSENEIFVDAGCYDGATSIKFAKEWNPQYKRIYAFEADIENCDRHGVVLKDELENFVLYPNGLWNRDAELHFQSQGSAVSFISEEGTNKVTCKRLDDCIIPEDQVTFIKMDIEGAELEALQGASVIISKQKPKLAICIYHKDFDCVVLAQYILKLNPAYRFYIRHYGLGPTETVLYAV